MNVGIVTAWYPAGAGYVSKQYEAALGRKHKVFIYARGQKDARKNPDWDHDNVTWAPKHYEPGSGIWKHHFAVWIKKHHIERIIFNEQRYYPAVKWARDMGVVCGSYVDYYTQDTIFNFRLFDFLICNTKRHLFAFRWHPRAFYVPWGVMPDILNREIDVDVDRPLTFMSSAGWTTAWDSDRRGGLIAIKAFKNVKGNCRFRLYSQNPFDKMTITWQNAIKADPRIELVVGTFSPFPYEDGDVYVYPSRLDGIGLTLPESIACGLPAITTNCAPMNEFVVDGDNGSLVDVEYYTCRGDAYFWPESVCSEDGVAKEMQRYVDEFDELKNKKLRAKEYAQKHFDWLKNSKMLSDIVVGSTKLDCEDVKESSSSLVKPIVIALLHFLSAIRCYVVTMGGRI